MIFEMKHKISLLLNQKIWKYLYVNNIFIDSLFLYLSNILFKLILELGNTFNKRQPHLKLQRLLEEGLLLEGGACLTVDTQRYVAFKLDIY